MSNRLGRGFKIIGEWFKNVLAFSRRKTETGLVFWSRVILLYLIRIGLIAYVILLSMQVAEQDIAVSVNRKEIDDIAVPNIYLGVYNNQADPIPEFRCLLYNATGKQYPLDAEIRAPCAVENITQKVSFMSSDSQWYKFDAKGRTFKNPYHAGDDEDYLAYVEIDYTITSNNSVLVIASAFHPDTDIFDPTIRAEMEAVSYASDLMGRIERDFFALSDNQLNLIRSTEHKVKKFQTTTASTFSGYRTNSIEYEYITTTMTTGNIPWLEGNASSVVILFPQDFVLDDETEEPDTTVLDLLNDVGGMGGLVFAIMVFLFGGDASGPWGVVQLCICRRQVKRKLRTELGQSTFNNKEDNIKQRLNALEEFLEEYVVDTTLLKTSRPIREKEDKNATENV